MKKLRLSTSILSSVVLSIALAACGGSDGDGGTPAMTSELVTAAAGGEVALEDGAGVNIPAGALAADTTITIASTAPADLPDADTLQGLVYDFGPNGTTFLAPVTLTLPMTGSPGDGETVVVSWLDGSTWTDLPTTMVGGEVTAPVEHFTRFIVRFRPDSLPGECEFTACDGGDVVGTWTLDSACLNDGENPFSEFCPTATVELDFSGSTGELIIGDGTYSADFEFNGTLAYTLPEACTGPSPDCPGMDDVVEGRSCVAASSGGGCSCTATITDDDPTADTGTYTVAGSTLTITSSDPQDETPTEVIEFCVSGDVLKLLVSNDNGLGQIITLRR